MLDRFSVREGAGAGPMSFFRYGDRVVFSHPRRVTRVSERGEPHDPVELVAADDPAQVVPVFPPEVEPGAEFVR